MDGNEMWTDFSQGRRDFILENLRRLGAKGTNPFSGKTYGEMLRSFNEFHPSHRIEPEEFKEK